MISGLLSTSLVWGSPEWLLLATALAALGLGVLLWSYWRARSSLAVRGCAGVLKALGILALAGCLVEPLLHGSRPRPGENLFVILADNSQSLQIRDRGQRQNSGALLRQRLAEESESRSCAIGCSAESPS